MSQVQVAGFNFSDFVFMAGDKLVTDTKCVAMAFGKRADNVIRKVVQAKDDLPDDFFRLNFEEVKETMAYTHNGIEIVKETSRTSHYTMTKDGFMFLVMGFTGHAAAQIKVAFISAFNKMADFIRQNQMSLWQQMQEWSARNASSSIRASFGSHLMLDRKKELPGLRSEYAILKDQIQPDMFAIK